MRAVILLNEGECVVPKMKTVRAMKAKFRVTATGKLKRNRPGRRHILTKKSSKRKRHLQSPAQVSVCFEKKFRHLMGE
jgi:large subunit ribosomal protein L35